MTTSQFNIILPDLGYPTIEVATAVGSVDLHNFADFLGYEYLVDGHLWLRWKLEDVNAQLAGRRVVHAALHFSGVNQLTVTPRDPDVPLTEDSALEHYECIERHHGRVRLAFEFVGGIKIEVLATSVILLAETL